MNLNDFCRVCFVEQYEMSDAEEREPMRKILSEYSYSLKTWFGEMLLDINNIDNENLRYAILNSMNFKEIKTDIIDELELEKCPVCMSVTAIDTMCMPLCRKWDENLCEDCAAFHIKTCKDCDTAHSDMVHRSTSTKVLTQ